MICFASKARWVYAEKLKKKVPQEVKIVLRTYAKKHVDERICSRQT